MRIGRRRILMGLIGLVIGIIYIATGYVVYWSLSVVWTVARPDPLTTVLTVLTAAVIFGYLSYLFGTARVLATLEAFELPPEQTPRVYHQLEQLSTTMDISQPRVYVGLLGGPNALSLGGPNSGIVVFDQSLFQLLSFDEFIGVLAHELAHLENHDSLIQTIAHSFIQLLITLAFILLLPVSLLLMGIAIAHAWIKGHPPIWSRTIFGRVRTAIGQVVILIFVALTLILFAHSRRREFSADDRAATVTGNPLALARALWKIERATTSDWRVLSPLYIRGDEQGLLIRLLSTHPKMDERIERLRKIATNQP